MPMTFETVSAGGSQYATLGLFLGPVHHTEPVRLDVSGLTTDEVDTDGYLKPGTPFKKDGTLVARHPGLVQKVIAGGVAGNHTVSGIGAGDRIVSVVHDTTAGALVDLTSEFSVTAANTINNAAGTDTSSDFLVVTYEPVDAYVYGVSMEPVKVATGNTSALLNAATDIDVALARFGIVNRDIAEDNLGRAYTANEIAAFAAAGSGLALTTT
jgi:hypothetical protein